MPYMLHHHPASNSLEHGQTNSSASKKHISVKCHTAMFNLQRLKSICYMLDENAAHTLVLGLVTSHIDYVNCILSGLPNIDINKLQKVQNAAAKFVCDKDKYSSTYEYGSPSLAPNQTKD